MTTATATRYSTVREAKAACEAQGFTVRARQGVIWGEPGEPVRSARYYTVTNFRGGVCLGGYPFGSQVQKEEFINWCNKFM
jgi:hypothetical protein